MAVETETTIAPTPTTNVGEQASTEQLEDLQAKAFSKKKSADPVPAQKKKEEPTPAADPNKNGAQRSKAHDLFEKTQKLGEDSEAAKAAANAKENEGGEDGETDTGFDGGSSFIDVSQFMEDDSTSVKKEEEPAPSDPDVDLDKEDNLKNLRKIAGTFKQERNDAQTKITQLEAELANRPDTTSLQGKMTKLEQRIAELEPYELAFGLHNNPQFKEKYIQGSENLVSEMSVIAKDYGVPEEVIDELLVSINRKEIDDLLSDSFSSNEARSDLKSLKQRYDALQKERREYEQKPQEALSKFEESQAEAKAQRNQKRDARFQEVYASSWAAALAANKEMADNKRINELIEVPGKKDHNERVVRPTIKAANDLLSAGMNHIEKMIRNEAVIDGAFASWLASICQQAAATQMINFSRAGLYQQYQELVKNQKQDRTMNRPGVVTPSRSVDTSAGEKKLSGKSRAAQIFSDVQEEFPIT